MVSLYLLVLPKSESIDRKCVFLPPPKWLDVVWYKIIPEPTETCRNSATKYFQMPEPLRSLYPIYFSRPF